MVIFALEGVRNKNLRDSRKWLGVGYIMIVMKGNKPDKFTLLRNNYSAQLRKKKEEVASLENKIRLLDELESDSLSLAKQFDQTEAAPRYFKVKLTDAALDAVGELGRPSVAQVKRYLLANGFVPKNIKNFGISVAKTLQRLHGQRKLETEKKENSRMYWRIDRPLLLRVAK
jgi:hypothetical protein